NYLEYDGTLSDEQIAELNTYFKEDLKNRGYSYLDVDVTLTNNGYDIRYQLSPELSKVLKNPDLKYTDIENNEKLDTNTKSYLREMLVGDQTMGESREAFYAKLKEIKASDVGKTTFDFTADVSFQFWLVFFISDMMYSNADTTTWNLRTQLITLGVALSITLVKFGAKIVNFFKRKSAEQEIKKNLETRDGKAVDYANESLQHKQRVSFFIRLLRKRNLEKAARNQLSEDDVITERYVEAVQLAEKPLSKKFRNRFFSIVKSVEEYEEIIRGETGDKASFVQKTTALKTAADMSIIGSFMEWVGSAAISALSHSKSVAAFFDSTTGGILGVVSFCIGTLIGATYYNKSVKPGLEKAKAALKIKFAENETKINLLKKFELENKKLRQIIKEKGLEKIPVLKGYSDRAFRRITTEKNNTFTYIKKAINRTGVVVGRIGTGILLFRLLPLAILSVVGISLAATISAILWPIAIAALVVGVIWAGIFLYKYVQDRRIASAKNFLDDIDNRLEAEQDANDVYRTQLRLEPRNQPFDEVVENQLPVREIAPLPNIVSKRLRFFEPAPRANEDLTLQYGGPTLSR
ncbi:MAG TPA: hypothetical protein VGU44_01055, partial [Gammaproteobacteria bacterium]|nr:hypothetical protein [Gammaproteobacteria bacterium]